MAYFLDLLSPETYEAFSKTEKDITGFDKYWIRSVKNVHPGDKFLCYLTKLSRWVGILEVTSEYFEDSSPRFYAEDDPYVLRFKVRPLVWLEKDKAIPIHEDIIWNHLSLLKGFEKNQPRWAVKFRASLAKIPKEDGKYLEELLSGQLQNPQIYPFNQTDYQKKLPQKVRGDQKTLWVSVPTEENVKVDNHVTAEGPELRQSMKIQALLAQIGEKMGFQIWIPKGDRTRVLQEWKPEKGSLIDSLPINYDEATNKTVEQIDVLWLHNRFIVRAFEVEQTTSIYSGILRMADLLALQPNIKIKLHIVAPSERRDKVFEEIRRPVFSLLENPLSGICTFISYDSLNELAKEKHLSSMRDNVLTEYEEVAE